MKNRIHNEEVLSKIKQIANSSKFKIIEITQEEEFNITKIAKETRLAYNKCSNYCSKLENHGLVLKRKEGKEVLVKSIIDLTKLSEALEK